MTARPASFLGKRAWQRLERAALRGHDRDLLRTVRDLSVARPEVLDATGSWMPGALSLQLSGRRVLLGGVVPSPAWSALAMAWSPVPLRLVKAGRYGKLWWIALSGQGEQLVLATHLRVVNDPGRPERSKLGLPVLSGAH